MFEFKISRLHEDRRETVNSFFLSVGLICLASFLAACATNYKNPLLDEKSGVLFAPSMHYKEAVLDLKAGYYEQASKKFKKIEQYYPYSKWARKSLIYRAFANYRQKKYKNAIITAHQYITSYPRTEETACAQYVIGLSYFEQIPEDINLDQKASYHTISAMQELINKFPKSRHVADAKEKIRMAQEKLAGKEMQIGHYYLQKQQYLAAISRFRSVVEKFSETQQITEALYRLVESYYTIGLIPEARDIIFVMKKKYPTSFWYKAAVTLLQKDLLKQQQKK